MTEEDLINEAKRYRRAEGLDPDMIKTVNDAVSYMQRLAKDCKEWGSD